VEKFIQNVLVETKQKKKKKKKNLKERISKSEILNPISILQNII